MDTHTSQTTKERQQSKQEDKGSKSLFFSFFLRKARKMIRKPILIVQLISSAKDYFSKYDSIYEFAQEAKEQFESIGRMTLSYVKGEYKGVALSTVILSIAALLYLVSPIDLVPDFLVGGLLDDMALLTWLYKTFSDEIERFLEWEDEHHKVQIAIDAKGKAMPNSVTPNASTDEDKL